MAFTLPQLPYAYDALEPYIDARTMEIHHNKHHGGYTKKLNDALEKHPKLFEKSIEALISNPDAIPEDIRTTVRNNGGGYYNHAIFWTVMGPQGGGQPSGALAKAIEAAFGDFEAFRQIFSNAAATRFGSGWAWLGLKGGKLEVISMPNQDAPLLAAMTPILGIDVWEHAYYLKYQNRRGDYIANWWNVVNWDEVARRFEVASK